MKNIQEISYEKAVNILTSQGKFFINLGLKRISSLLELYNNPQDKIKCIHVAGTNGKGSTCAMLASVLTESGYKTGLYTSPHLVDYTERLKISGKDIPKEYFADLIFDITATAEKNNIHATEFEILTALAFIYFEKEKADFAIIETGLGGRFDATNIIKNPLFSIITTIDLDHIDRLGDTVEKIAFEKAGIIKSLAPIITLKDNKGLSIIQEKAMNCESKLVLADSDSSINYETNLMGLWQKKNLSLVLKAIEVLKSFNVVISKETVQKGLKNVEWNGRFQYIEEKNLILDGAHNPNAAKLLVDSLNFYYPDKERIWIYSSISTKNFAKIMEILFRPQDTIIFTGSTSNASVPAEILKDNLQSINNFHKIYLTKNIKEALSIYSNLISGNSMGIMAGSLYSIGDFFIEDNHKNN